MSKETDATMTDAPVDEDLEEESPKEQKKGILGSLKKLKRTLSDRSPEAATSSSTSRPRFNLVGVIVPEPPLPHSSYTQLGVPPSAPPIAEVPHDRTPPISSSPSIASFESTGSDPRQQFEVNRLRLQLNASQEELNLVRVQSAARERQMNARFAAEQALLEARIQELEGRGLGEGSGSSHRA